MELGCEPTSVCLHQTALVETMMLVCMRKKPEQFEIHCMVTSIRAVLGIIVKSVSSDLRMESLSFTWKDWMLLRSWLPTLCTSLPNLFPHTSVLLYTWFSLSREYPVQHPLISKKSAGVSTLGKSFLTRCVSSVQPLPAEMPALASLRAVITLYCDHCFPRPPPRL